MYVHEFNSYAAVIARLGSSMLWHALSTPGDHVITNCLAVDCCPMICGSLMLFLESMWFSSLGWCMLVLAQASAVACSDPLDHMQGLVLGLLNCFIYLCSSD
jgi:hypothetical protein